MSAKEIEVVFNHVEGSLDINAAPNSTSRAIIKEDRILFMFTSQGIKHSIVFTIAEWLLISRIHSELLDSINGP